MRLPFLSLALIYLAAHPLRTIAQWTFLDLPVESQAASVSQTIGTTRFTVTYSRPSAKGRVIWGDVVAYDEVWRAGANENTVFTASSDFTVEGQPVKAGTYGLHMIPSKEKWTIILSSDHQAWGSYYYKKENDVVRVQVSQEPGPMTENLTYEFADLTANSATLTLRWAEMQVPIKIGVDVHAVVLARMDDQLRGLSSYNWEPWYEAARYCHDEKIGGEQAMKYVDRSIRLQANFENQSLKSDMLKAAGKTAEAAALKQTMIDGATNAQLNTYAYTLLNNGEKEEAMRMFELNVKRHPKDANAQDSLGEGYMMVGNKEAAIKAFKKSLSMDPAENVKSNSLRCLKKLGVDTSGYETSKK
jgi:tetratricopeptide (TPR) repeat protein